MSRCDRLGTRPRLNAACHSFFISARPAIKAIGKWLYPVLTTLRLCPKEGRAYDLGQPSNFHIAMPGRGSLDPSARVSMIRLFVNLTRLSSLVLDLRSADVARRQ